MFERIRSGVYRYAPCRVNSQEPRRPNRASKHNRSSVASWWAARESCGTALRHLRFGTARITPCEPDSGAGGRLLLARRRLRPSTGSLLGSD